MPQCILKHGQCVTNDSWALIQADTGWTTLPDNQDLLVPLSLWQSHSAQLNAREGGLGIWLASDETVESVVDELEHFQLIALEFPAFTDGRHYSSARILRDYHHYSGELRAIGDIQIDELFYLKRCGFDSFALREGQNLQDAQYALEVISVTYQPSSDQPLPLFRRRQAS